MFFSFIHSRNSHTKFSHVNKTFNIDIASISAPITNSGSVNVGNGNNTPSSSSSSSTSSSSTASSTDSHVDHIELEQPQQQLNNNNNNINSSYPNKQISKIQVIEDDEQVKKPNQYQQYHNHILQQHFQQQQQQMNENNFVNNNLSDMSDCSSISLHKFKKPINYDSLIGDRFVYNNSNQLVNLDRHSFHENQLQSKSLTDNNNNKGKLDT